MQALNYDPVGDSDTLLPSRSADASSSISSGKSLKVAATVMAVMGVLALLSGSPEAAAVAAPVLLATPDTASMDPPMETMSAEIPADVAMLGSERGPEMCASSGFRSHTLKALKDDTYMSLFHDLKGQKKFEASDVIIVDDHYYSVCDSNWAIAKIHHSVTPFSDDNIQIGDPKRMKEDSGYEGIFHVEGKFFVVRESVDLEDAEDVNEYHAIVEELVIHDDERDYEVVNACPAELAFDGDSKGFEGATGLVGSDGILYMLGLCEGNNCKEGQEGQERGNGRIVLMKQVHDISPPLKGGYTCQWQTVRTMELPASAFFKDYSALAIDATGRVAITSQEDSQVWISTLTDFTDGKFNPATTEFSADNVKVYDFPRDGNCNVIYCNIEGIHWYGHDNKNVLVAVSDKMKNNGKQDFRCQDKDQSIHFFGLP